MKKLLFVLLPLLVALVGSGCATGLSKYRYERCRDGECIKASVDSANEIGVLEMGIEVMPDGSKELRVKMDNMTKNDNTAAILESVNGITSDFRAVVVPFLPVQPAGEN